MIHKLTIVPLFNCSQHCELAQMRWEFIYILVVQLMSALSGIDVHISRPSSRGTLISLLQKASNGFDIRGITDSYSAHQTNGPQLNNELAFWIGVGFGEYVKHQHQTCLTRSPSDSVVRNFKVGIGRDSRQSGIELTSWFAGGLNAVGVDGYDTGICTTPSMYLSCDNSLLQSLCKDPLTDKINTVGSPWPFDGAVSITASHLPREWNGFKFFAPNFPTNIGSEGIDAIIGFVSDPKFDSLEPYKAQRVPITPFIPVYSQFLQQTIKRIALRSTTGSLPLKGLKLCVNAGNGAGGFLAQTLAELGADTSSSLHLEPDGRFPNHVANPEDKAAIAATAKRVADYNADLGICLDADADRVGLVEGSSGEILNRNKLIALVATIAVQNLRDGEGTSSATIVTDSATSNGLSKYITSTLSAKHIRYKKGYRYVIEKARSIDDAVVAVECSGHGAWRDNGWVDDGCYTAIRILSELCNLRHHAAATKTDVTLSQLIAGYQEPAESHEFRLKARTDSEEFKSGGMAVVTERALEVLRHLVATTDGWAMEPVNYEGLRVTFMWGDGWVMMRASLHEPILSMHVESEVVGGVQYAVKQLLESSPGLRSLQSIFDLSSLERAIMSA